MMDTHNQADQRAILHVIHDPDATTSQMQQALLQTGRTVLIRNDLYQAAGALAASKHGTPIDSIFISAGTISHQDGEFFQLTAAAFDNVAIYIYGRSHTGSDQIVPPHSVTWVTPERVSSLIGGSPVSPAQHDRSGLPAVDETPAESEAPTESDEQVAELEISQELENRLLHQLGKDVPTQAETSEDSDDLAGNLVDAEKTTEAPADTEAETDEHDDRPPVPWNPSLARPARTPPRNRSVLEVTDASDDQVPQTNPRLADTTDPNHEQPLLTREELDALLHEGHDSSDGPLEQRV